MRILFICMSFAFPSLCFSQLDSLKGKIKWVKDSVIYSEKSYLVLNSREYNFGQYMLMEEDLFGEYKGDLLPRPYIQYDKERQFDEKGRLIKTRNIYPKINSSSSIYYSYDEPGNLVQERHEYSDSEYEVTNYRYEPLKRGGILYLSSEITYENDPGRFFLTQYFYNGRFQLLEEIKTSSYGGEDKTYYHYDEDGNLVEEIHTSIKKIINYDSKLKREMVQDTTDHSYSYYFSYYPDGKLKEKTSLCSPAFVRGVCQRTVYEYDDKGRRSKIFYYWTGKDSLFSHREYEYYPDNSVKKINWFLKQEDNPKSSIEYFYTNKEITKVILVNTEKTMVIEFEYKLDGHKNWIEQKKIVNNDLFYTRKREIVYWD